MDLSDLPDKGFPESILLIFPYAAQRSRLLQDVNVALTNVVARIIIKIFFIRTGNNLTLNL